MERRNSKLYIHIGTNENRLKEIQMDRQKEGMYKIDKHTDSQEDIHTYRT